MAWLSGILLQRADETDLTNENFNTQKVLVVEVDVCVYLLSEAKRMSDRKKWSVADSVTFHKLNK